LCTLGIGRIIRNKYLRTSPQLPAVLVQFVKGREKEQILLLL